MKKIKQLLIVFCMGLMQVTAQTEPQILVQPYLQDAEPNSIVIMWETSSGEESIVEWGTTEKLGKKAFGKAEDINFSDSRVHTVKLEGLKRFTEYYYRVKTGKTKSDIFQFKTPPFSSDEESFNIVAMSDMQYDSQHPNKFSEIVNQGVLQYLEKEHGGKLPDNLAMVMIPGDLVSTGSKYYQWKEHFFDPAQKLFAEVPVYPVLGNHERNSVFYFKYFSLPENGTPAYAEHWWYKDYGNTRIIGLNSNDGYRDLRNKTSGSKKCWPIQKGTMILILFLRNCITRTNPSFGFPVKKNQRGKWLRCSKHSLPKQESRAFIFLDIHTGIPEGNPEITNIYGSMWPPQVVP